MLTADRRGCHGVEILTSEDVGAIRDFDKVMPSDLIRHRKVCSGVSYLGRSTWGFHGK